jgi:3-dehydroquinate synthase
MSVIQRSIHVGWQLRVFFTEDVFAPANLVLKTALGNDAGHAPRKALVVLDESLAHARPDLARQIEDYFSAPDGNVKLASPPLVIEGGERAKNSPLQVAEIHSQIDRHHLDRHSYLIAVGGGALLDAAGFAAATAHRGIRHVRIPTTTLSQADSGIGVKNGINAFGKKNFIGTFAPPHAVINDFNLLATLEPRDQRAGYVEAVKVACIRDHAFFGEIERDAAKLTAFEPAAMKRLIQRCAELHLDHIATSGDPFELGSARPLDFGHWSAHKLEQLSNFQIRHGEAVAIGIALDVVYSRHVGWLDAPSAERILTLLERLGFDLFANELLNVGSDGQLQVLGGLNEFREHLGGDLTITLLREIGRGKEAHEVNLPKVVEAIHELRERHGTRTQKIIRARA